MKKMWIGVTAVFAAFILAAGIILLPVVYSVLFDAEKIVYDEENLPEEIAAAPGLFMERFRYPLLEETQELPEETREAHVDFRKSILGPEIYEHAFRLVGLEEDSRFWEELTVTEGGSVFLIETMVEKGGEEYLLSVAMNEELLPFLICCKNSREPSEAEVQEAVEKLWEICRTKPESLLLYTEEIDEIYDTSRDYHLQVNQLYISLLPEENSMNEISDRVPLWDCCIRGEWQVCSDGREVVLVCVMGRGDLVLYYDAVAKEFCGYRIQFGNI